MVKAACAKVLNLNASDSRVLDYVNRAIERLLYEGKWKDTLARYAVCVTNGCLVWPRQIETIEGIAVCESPFTIRNGFYEFLENGPGVLKDTSAVGLTMVDRGNVVAFDTPLGTGKKLAIYADGTEAAGTVLLRYFDSNGNRVFTTYQGAVIEGERLTIPAAGAYTYSTYQVLPSGLYAVIKPVTKYPIRLYEYAVAGGALKALAYYEPDEVVPEYRASFIPCLAGQGCGTAGCSSSIVTIIAKLRYIPATGDDSILMIPHTDAIRLGVQAVKKEEDNMLDEAQKYWMTAIRSLDQQLKHWKGSGVVAPIRMVGSSTYGGGITNII